MEIRKRSGHERTLSTHPKSHLGLLTPDPGDGIRSDLVSHLLGQVLGSLNDIQSLEGEHRPGLRTELSDRGLGSWERKGWRGRHGEGDLGGQLSWVQRQREETGVPRQQLCGKVTSCLSLLRYRRGKIRLPCRVLCNHGKQLKHPEFKPQLWPFTSPVTRQCLGFL